MSWPAAAEEEPYAFDMEEAINADFRMWEEDMVKSGRPSMRTAAEVVAEVVRLGRRAWRGQEFIVESGDRKVLLLVQRMSTDESVCEHCRQVHPFLIVQTIASQSRRKGHGSALMRELADAVDSGLSHGGVLLQSCVTTGSVRMAKKLGMTPCTGDANSFVLCRRRGRAE